MKPDVRTILTAVTALAGACRATDAIPRPTPAAKEAPTMPATLPATMSATDPAIEVSTLDPQQRGAPIAIAGDRVAWRRGDQLEVWDLADKRRVAGLDVPEPSFAIGVAEKGFVIVAGDVANKRARAIRIAPGTTTGTEIEAEQAFYFHGADRVLAAGAGEIWVSEGSSSKLARYRLGVRASHQSSIGWTMGQGRTLAAGGSRVVFYERGTIVAIAHDDVRTAFAVDGELAGPLHLAPGPRPATLWATASDELRLVELAGETASIAARARVPGVYHLAAAGDFAAVLSVAMSAGAWDEVTLTVFDRDATPRWNVTIPTPIQPDGWVVASASHVAVVFGDDLRVYAAKDGRAILP